MNILEIFVAVCRDDPKRVFPNKKVKDDAERLLTLRTQEELLAFVGNGGLEQARVVNKPLLRDRNGKETHTTIHAYKFSSNMLQMYIAFYYAEDTGNWILKSFHEPNDPEPTLGPKLQQAILQKLLEKK